MSLRPPIDVVVPVYNAPDDLRACIASVLEHTSGDYRLVLIDDASTDPGVREVLDALAARALPHVTVLANEENLGFTRTANRGMSLSRNDVVLLNSDAIVTNDWLDALARCVASDPRIGTATPFSNNAEVCSFPSLCVNHPWPAGADPEPMRRALAEAAVPLYPDLPTGVGFCFYIRRALLDAIGPFDPAFGAGYGEENDFCMRAAKAGFRNVLCDDAFVLHTGGKSFAGAKEHLGARNTRLLESRHPEYLPLVRDFIERDPVAALRQAARTAYDRRNGPRPAVLHLLHGHGGTETYVRSLAAAAPARRNVLAFVHGDRWRIDELRSDGSAMLCEFGRRANEPHPAFLRMLADVYGIDVVHVHSLAGDHDGLVDALLGAGLPYGLTIHDLQVACPTITLQRADHVFCGGVTDEAVCTACLREQPRHAHADIARWRERHRQLLEQAAFVIAPSRWAATMVTRYFPTVRVEFVPHGAPVYDNQPRAAANAVLMPDDGRATVAILGAIGPDKGARRVERLAALARERAAPVRFVVVGYLDRTSRAWQSDDATLTINGRYDPRNMKRLLDHYGARLVVFPSFGPETFAYTLSEAWSAGRAVLVPPIGALAERVNEHGGGWILDEREWHDEGLLLDRIVALVDPRNAATLDAACAAAGRVVLPSLSHMHERTLAAWRDAAAGAPVRHGPVDRLRVVEAMGYRRWSPSTLAEDSLPATSDAGLPPTVQRLRATRVGRAIARLIPQRARAALLARLRT